MKKALGITIFFFLIFSGLIFVLIGFYLYKNWNSKEFKNIRKTLDKKVKELSNFVEEKTNEANKVLENVVESVEKIENDLKKEAVKRTNMLSSEISKKKDIKLNVRQRKLLEFVKNSSEVDMKSVSKKFPKVSQRTLRRDMDKLEELKLVAQSGKTRNSVYRFIK